jgi:hypothetical protein
MLTENWPGNYEELKKSLPPWMVIVCISGYQRRPDERVAIQEKHLFNICGELKLKPQASLPGGGSGGGSVSELLSNAWQKEPYWKLRSKGSCHDIFFLTPMSRAAEYVRLMKGIVAKYHYSFEDIGCYIQPMVQGRGCHCEFNLPCDGSNAAEVDELRTLFLEASEALMMNGAFFSRPYGPWADMVYSRNPEGVAALRKIKSIFDPNNILNPGKLCF